MNFLGGYGSDSDDDIAKSVKSPIITKNIPINDKNIPMNDKTISNVSTKTNNSSTNNINKSSINNNNNIKKVKKLDISILPADIQAALLNNDSKLDSDSDDDNNNIKIIRKNNNTSNNKGNVLLNLLPKPNGDNLFIKNSLNKPSTSSSIISNGNKINDRPDYPFPDEDSDDDNNLSLSISSTNNNTSTGSKINKPNYPFPDENSDEDSDEDSSSSNTNSTSLFNIPSSFKSSSSSVAPTINRSLLATAPSVATISNGIYL
jgi:hypothetical protein